ncbi:MAG: ATP-dependent helicase [Lachnospiraceae bacterium]|nr:ATP-dependent helicase [Lachnospiraceae bacterium]
MLNEYQKQAVEHFRGPCLTIAPPGSGKTKCLVERVMHLIWVHHCEPDKILVVTFTKDAACEMKERFCKEFSSDEKLPFFGTFHSLFYHILKEEYHLGHASIMTSGKAYLLLKKAFFETKESYDNIPLSDVLKELSYCINNGIKVEEYASVTLKNKFVKIVRAYERLKEEEGVIDFDDMMTKVYELFIHNPKILQKWQNRFSFVLLDEMQDINQLQFDIIKLLLTKEENIFAVGDDDQSIYEFRGSKPQIMLDFKKTFPKASIITLEMNYRSLRQIISCANHLIRNNHSRYEKNAKGFLKEYGKVTYLQFEDEMQQALGIIQKIETMKENRSLGVLYRNKSDVFLLTQLLEWKHIPYFSKEIINQKLTYSVVSDMIAYFKKGYGIEEDSTIKEDVSALRNLSFYAGVNYIRKGLGYDRKLLKMYENAPYLYEGAMELCNLIQEEMGKFKKGEAILTVISHLESFQVSQKYLIKDKNEAKVCLYTFHGSKGLEFDEVVCININEGIVPSMYNEMGLEEERRMFYVAITRAKFSLTISCIKNRGGKPYQPSRFINEMKY